MKKAWMAQILAMKLKVWMVQASISDECRKAMNISDECGKEVTKHSKEITNKHSTIV